MLNRTTNHEQQNGATRAPSIEPRVDIYEGEQEYLLLLDVPGVTPDGVDLRVDPPELVIRATPSEAGSNVAFTRRFTLSDDVDAEHVDAELAAGVLRVKLPKRPELRRRRVDVRAA